MPQGYAGTKPALGADANDCDDYFVTRLKEKRSGCGSPSGRVKFTPPNRTVPASVSPVSTPSKRLTPRGRMPFILPHVNPLGVTFRYSRRFTTSSPSGDRRTVSPTTRPSTILIRSVFGLLRGSSAVIHTCPTHSPMYGRASSGVGKGVASSPSTVSVGGGRRSTSAISASSLTLSAGVP